MIEVKAFIGANGYYKGFTVTGHAGYASDRDRYDLVCAAVSAVTLTTAFGLQDILKERGTYESNSGSLIVSLTDGGNAETDILIQSMLHGLKLIRDQHPENLKLQEAKG